MLLALAVLGRLPGRESDLRKLGRGKKLRTSKPPAVGSGGAGAVTSDASLLLSSFEAEIRPSFSGGVAVIRRSDVYGCRQTGQNQPFAFLLRLGGCAVAATGGAVEPVAPLASLAPLAVAGCSPVAGVAFVAGATGASASVCTKVPPAPNSTILTAHSRQATRCLHGSKTTSLGEERHRRHSDVCSSPACSVGG